ncbi:hypothetical protein [Micromonospora globbae]|uniref:Uncharacterized protein n=1 Tax=Micromonospora globbae TaxID=1894969 RepID=A0A420ETV5_9ACTN|nr:hypothetical protein [Micromonospora globbae]RKF24144.1 hypothetical protein D7I43_28080 [Micromonospora globbae]
MSGYYLAPSLAVLRAEINQRWPHRDKASDGWIGDTRHQAGKSDHNPNARGSVNAIDVDKDGVDVAAIIAAVERHPSTHYWIFNRQIADRDDGWRRRPYSGENPHDKHLHVSIRQSRTAEQDQRPWGLLEDDMDRAEFLAHFRAAIADDSIVRSLRAIPWQYVGGGIPEGFSTLKVLNDTYGLAAQAARAAGVDVDEQEIVAGVLAGLTPEKIAAAVPDGLARDVVDELTRRLAS